jgi:putative glycosyltransferase (TIGR04372 family)
VLSNLLKEAFNRFSDTKYWEVIVADQNAIGHNVGDFLNFVFEKHSNKQKKRIFLIYSRHAMANIYMLDIWKVIRQEFGEFELIGIPHWLYKLICKFVVFSKPPSISQYSGCSGTHYDEEYITRTKELVSTNIIMKVQSGIDEIDDLKAQCGKIVVILQRDPVFRGADTARDTPIEDLNESISYLLHRGFGVVRITKSSASKVDYVHPNLIDIPFTHKYTDLKFLKVFKIADYAVSNWFGPMELLRLFGIPTLFVNVPPTFREFPKRNKTFILLTKMQNSNGHPLEEKEFIQFFSGSHSPRDVAALSGYGIFLSRNSPQEILDALIEFLQCVELPHSMECLRCSATKRKLMELDAKNISKGIKNSGIGEMEYSNVLSGIDFLNANFCLTKKSQIFL